MLYFFSFIFFVLLLNASVCFFFFFQAEDGIRDKLVTGVQTVLFKATYLPAMASGRHIWTQLFSEPNAGSDLTGLQSRAQLDGDHYVVNGQKVWSTWAQWSDFGYLLARSEPVPGAGGITAFILDMHTPGVEVRPLREMTGTTDFCEVFFDDVRVPVADVIGSPGQGWTVANASLAAERGGVGGRS